MVQLSVGNKEFTLHSTCQITLSPWDIFSLFFSRTILVEYFNSRYKRLSEFKPGDMIISKSDSSSEHFVIGKIVSTNAFPQKKNSSLIPIISVGNKEYVAFGIVRRYSKELETALTKLTPREQWLVMSRY